MMSLRVKDSLAVVTLTISLPINMLPPYRLLIVCYSHSTVFEETYKNNSVSLTKNALTPNCEQDIRRVEARVSRKNCTSFYACRIDVTLATLTHHHKSTMMIDSPFSLFLSTLSTQRVTVGVSKVSYQPFLVKEATLGHFHVRFG